jgi:hypothetical protein
MNERIEKLWTQAGGHYNSGNQHTWPQYTIDNPEKFVELIIRECMEVVENKCDETPDGDGFHMGEFCGVLMATIEEHFGVEEQDTESNEWHTCPYAEEIHHDYDTLCDCDEERTYQCARDI